MLQWRTRERHKSRKSSLRRVTAQMASMDRIASELTFVAALEALEEALSPSCLAMSAMPLTLKHSAETF
jgi:hypothetical protein